MKDSKLLKIMDFEQIEEYERLRNLTWVGFAHVYLFRCNKVLKSNNEIDIELYTKLAELDSRIGTTAAEILFSCLYRTRWDLIKVLIKIRVLINLNIYLR